MRQIVIPLNIIFLMNWLTLVLSEDPVLRYEVGKKKLKKRNRYGTSFFQVPVVPSNQSTWFLTHIAL